MDLQKNQVRNSASINSVQLKQANNELNTIQIQKGQRIKTMNDSKQEKQRRFNNIQIIENERKLYIPQLNLPENTIMTRRKLFNVSKSQQFCSSSEVELLYCKSYTIIGNDQKISQDQKLNKISQQNQIKNVKEAKIQATGNQKQLKENSFQKKKKERKKTFRNLWIYKIITNELFVCFAFIFGMILFKNIATYFTGQQQ